MAHSKPTDITNKGDALRLTAAAGAFIIHVVTDQRAERQYPNWLEARKKLDALLARWPNRREEILASYKPVELAEHQRFVRDGLGLTAWAHWVGPALMNAWECRRDDREFGIPVVVDKNLEPGKKPRAGADDIMRNVEWFYRNEVKNPSDSVSELEREYARAANRITDARSVVQNGIKQARALLDIIGRDGLTERK
jgi:hypothetical protein